MGDWTIVVEGTGSHHNADYPNDANILTKQFVDDLKAKGHTIRRASFTSGIADREVSELAEGRRA